MPGWQRRHQIVSIALAVGLAGALCVACLLPVVVAGVMQTHKGPHGFVADVCVGVRRVQHTQFAIGWISPQASRTIARPSPYYWKPGFAVCGFLPWSPLLREQGGFVFPA